MSSGNKGLDQDQVSVCPQDFGFILRGIRPACLVAFLQKLAVSAQSGSAASPRQRALRHAVAIARALALDPEVMLFDEPTSALDPEMINEVLDVMAGLAQDGMTMMCVTHEMGFARKVADRMVFMDKGEIVEDRPTEAFFERPASPRASEFLNKIIRH